MLTEIALVFVLALCNGFFALSEMALVASRKSRLKQMAKTSRRAALALRHAEAPEHFLSTVQVGITLLMLITGAIAGDALGAHLADALQSSHLTWLMPYARIIGIVLGFVLISFVQIVVGELVPKRLALSAPERFSTYAAIPMLVLSRLTAPFVWLLNVSSNLLLHLLRVSPHGHGVVTEDEIRLLVAESAEQGVLDPDEHNMVNRVRRARPRRPARFVCPNRARASNRAASSSIAQCGQEYGQSSGRGLPRHPLPNWWLDPHQLPVFAIFSRIFVSFSSSVAAVNGFTT